MGNDLTIDHPRYNFKGLKLEKNGVCMYPDRIKSKTLIVLYKLY